jgi:hypothetical protein
VAYLDEDITLDQLTELVPQAQEFQQLDALLVRNGRWSSLMCDDPGCCPKEGNALNDITATDLEFVVAGSAPFASREDLASCLESRRLEPEQISLRDAAWKIIEEEFEGERVKHKSKVPARSDYLDRLMRLWREDAKWDWQAHGLLTLIVSDIQMRDGLLRQMLDQPSLRLAIRTTLMSAISQSHEDHVAPLATALAGCAWLDGNGALTTVALDRALEVDSSYSLARLLERALSQNVPPSVWTESLEAVSYEECLAGAA